MGREVRLGAPARRVCSLVPSETEAVVMLAGVGALVGRTDYCVEPRGSVEAVPTVGGTKDARIEDIVALAPDLVLANQEENTPQIVRALEAAGLATHVSFPKTVEDAAALMRDLACMLGVPMAGAPQRSREESGSAVLAEMDTVLRDLRARREARAPVRVFCPIWMEPLMTIHGETFLSDALDLAGAFNVFSDRPRRYPLAADLGRAAPLSLERLGGRDTRYPRVTLEEVRMRAPSLVLLPDEPHPFSEADAAVFHALEGVRVVHVSGRDLSWYSPRMGRGIAAIADVIDAHRAG